MKFKPGIVLVSIICLGPSALAAWQVSDRLEIKGLADFRAAISGQTTSFQNHGFGKTRWGGSGGQSQLSVRVGELAATLKAELTDTLDLQLYGKADGETKNTVDLVEGYLHYRPIPSETMRIRVKLGAFFPPMSLENTDLAWTSPYSITPSAINSWIGEELRTIGLQWTLIKKDDDDVFRLYAALFGVNDPAGALLTWRGFGFTDRKTGLLDRVPIPDIPSVQQGGVFERQSPYIDPFKEIDSRLGAYAGASWSHLEFVTLEGIVYHNMGNPERFSNGQYAWKTKFFHLGGALQFPENIEVLGQYLHGASGMGRSPLGLLAVDINFKSFYLMASKRMDPHRVSLRFDYFRVDDNAVNINDDARESGQAWTLAYSVKTWKRQKLFLEAIRYKAQRATHLHQNVAYNNNEFQLQLAYRILI